MNARILCLIGLFLASWTFAQEGGAEKQWYKGNLHTHSLWSDGNDFPEMIAKWYADNDYDFLSFTEHNIMSQGEKWFSIAEVEKRGGKVVLEKCITAMGEDWIETRTNDKDQKQVRLKTLEDFRGKFESPNEFLMLTGEEISDSVDGFPLHMNATNLTRTLRPAGGKTIREAMNNNLRAAIDQAKSENREVVVHLNHPNFGWAITAEDLAFVTLEKFFEVYNGHPGIRHLGDEKHASVERIWDIANTLRISKLDAAPLFGMGTDDSHHYHGRENGASTGRGWIMVHAAELSPDSLMAAINQGEFYASSGVTLESVKFDSDSRTLNIDVEPVEGETYSIEFIGTLKGFDASTENVKDADGNVVRTTKVYSDEVGKVLQTSEGNSASYQCTGEELYVRALITSSSAPVNPSFANQKKQAWTQPVGWR
jgi:predicted metal-dependent phosphoesterase TrpH